MRKFIFMFIMMFASLIINAQTYVFRATEFAYKYVNSYGRWTDWTDWEKSNVVITIDLNKSVVRINSETPQTYVIVEWVRNYRDEDGGEQIEFKFVDQDYDRGTMRLRTERNGNPQIYIDFANVMWVYNVKKI